MSLSKTILDLIVCPQTKSPLHYDRQSQELISIAAGVAYPVRDAIPILLAEEARRLTETELEKWRKKQTKLVD